MSLTEKQLSCEVFPRIVRTGGETGIDIQLPAARDGDEFEVSIHHLEGTGTFSTAQGPVYSLPCRAQDGALRLHGAFSDEGEYLLHVDAVGEGDKSPVGDVRLYALEGDLFARMPYKGDLHMHSDHSDGVEPPEYVTTACREVGLDFMAVTDHWRYSPSLKAQRAFADAPIDLRIYPGEEVHFFPYNPVHIINFGGRHSVNALISSEELAPGERTFKRTCNAEYLEEVQAIADAIDDPSLTPERRFQYAQCVWTYGKIREAGGLAIFCHPYWFEWRNYNVPEPIIVRHFAEQPFDAYELIGGYHKHEVESNLLQVARYHEERAKGRQLPIVGVTDAHGCHTGSLFGWYYTIVFSPSLELPDLIDSVKALYSVAVEALPGETPRAHGPFRLVKYAQFLIREVFPAHDALCAEEGRLMRDYLDGKRGTKDALQVRRGRVTELYRRYWGDD